MIKIILNIELNGIFWGQLNLILQFNNVAKELDSRDQFVKYMSQNKIERFLLCVIINYCLIIQFILLYYYILNIKNDKYFLIGFEFIGPVIFWIITVLTMSIWYVYNTQLPNLNDEILYYQNLHFKYDNQTETASVLNFFLTLNQNLIFNKIIKKDKYKRIIINIILIFFAIIYCAMQFLLFVNLNQNQYQFLFQFLYSYFHELKVVYLTLIFVCYILLIVLNEVNEM